MTKNIKKNVSSLQDANPYCSKRYMGTKSIVLSTRLWSQLQTTDKNSGFMQFANRCFLQQWCCSELICSYELAHHQGSKFLVKQFSIFNITDLSKFVVNLIILAKPKYIVILMVSKL